MAELADALDSGSSARKGVEVQVLFFALMASRSLVAQDQVGFGLWQPQAPTK